MVKLAGCYLPTPLSPKPNKLSTSFLSSSCLLILKTYKEYSLKYFTKISTRVVFSHRTDFHTQTNPKIADVFGRKRHPTSCRLIRWMSRVLAYTRLRFTSSEINASPTYIHLWFVILPPVSSRRIKNQVSNLNPTDGRFRRLRFHCGNDI
jgi:hypothetical protein